LKLKKKIILERTRRSRERKKNMENEAVASQPRARKRYLDENPSHPPLHPVPLNFEALGGGGSNPNASAVQGNPSGTGSVSFFNTDMKMKAIKSRRMIGIDADFHKRSPVLAPINRDIRVPETHLGRSAQNTAQPCLPSLMRSPKGFQFPPQLDDEPKENFARPVARRLYQTSATTPKNSLPLVSLIQYPHFSNIQVMKCL
jgi:hypothetical protein